MVGFRRGVGRTVWRLERCVIVVECAHKRDGAARKKRCSKLAIWDLKISGGHTLLQPLPAV